MCPVIGFLLSPGRASRSASRDLNNQHAQSQLGVIDQGAFTLAVNSSLASVFDPLRGPLSVLYFQLPRRPRAQSLRQVMILSYKKLENLLHRMALVVRTTLSICRNKKSE